MNAFHRLSLGPTLPDLISLSSDVRQERAIRRVPLQAWCRAATARRVQANGAIAWHKPPVSMPPALRVGAAIRIRVYLGAASLVLSIARGLQCGGVLGHNQAASALRWSGRLSAKAVAIWRKQRSRPL